MTILKYIRQQKQRLMRVGLLALGLVFVAYGASGFVAMYQATHNPEPEIVTTVVTESTEEPDETVPSDDCSIYGNSASLPVRIEIPSLEISHCIQRVGIDQHGAIAVPTNIHLAGWFVDSAVPGEEGVSIIDGHVQGRYRDAIFTRLPEIALDEEVIVHFGDGSTKTFEVVEAESHTVAEAESVLFSKRDDIERQLTLITCTGSINEQDSFTERFIVKARHVSSDPSQDGSDA